MLLLEHQWNNNAVVEKYRQDANALLVTARIKPPSNVAAEAASTSAAAVQLLRMGNNGYKTSTTSSTTTSPSSNTICINSSINPSSSQYRRMCPVCASSQPSDKFYSLACGHSFCKDCWTIFFETQIFQVHLLPCEMPSNISMHSLISSNELCFDSVSKLENIIFCSYCPFLPCFCLLAGYFNTDWLYGTAVQCSCAGRFGADACDAPGDAG